MSYTALRKMKEQLQSEHSTIEMGPAFPSGVIMDDNKRTSIKTAVAHFIHERCTDLRFNPLMELEELKDGKLKGTSSRFGQIPFNMQMDIDRLCLSRAIDSFMESGTREDAFDVYFCYLEMFGGGYSSSRRMIELLSEYESTASTVLMSHRDHYSHSVYVFLLGLALYDSIPIIQNEYKKFYGISDDRKAAHHYLQFWGMTSLFHDIGYPFEISFEQVKSYFSQKSIEDNRPIRPDSIPYVCFGNMDEYLRIDDDSRAKLKDWYDKDFYTIEEWLAYDITNLLKRSNCERIRKKTREDISRILYEEARPSGTKLYLDHAYFSAIVLFKELFQTMNRSDGGNVLMREHMDALTAIALHNTLYKRKITEDSGLILSDHAFMIDWHPLAYILQLADELQCWDRTSYGRNSRNELHSMSCNLEFDSKGVYAEYVYDSAESKKIIDYWTKYEEYRDNPDTVRKPKLKKYSDMTHEKAFAKELGLIVGLSNYGECKGSIRLEVTQKVEKANWSSKQLFLSESNFIHLYEFAAAINSQYNRKYATDKEILDDFDTLSLEYKLSNIGQAKGFAKALDGIGCFFTDRPVAYEMVTDFNEEELLYLGAVEHKRWEKEKKEMYWLPGKEVADVLKNNGNELREKARMHYDLDQAFKLLRDEEKDKDISHLNVMLNKLLEFDGVRVYRYKNVSTR